MPAAGAVPGGEGRGGGRALRDLSGLELFAREVMAEFHEREADQQRWKSLVLDGRVALEQVDTSSHTVYAYQNEDIVRLTPEELKRKMAAKEATQAAHGPGGGGDA